MLYLDYSRKQGEWIPNQYGGRENLEAIDFLQRRSTSDVYEQFPDVQTIAEESTAWPMVSRPTYIGGLGFGMKWDMGWMHDTLDYFAQDPIHRKYHHNKLTFRGLYAFTENFVLPLSHDEVVHGKGSLHRQDAGRRLAEVRQPAPAVRLHVHPARQEAAVHGRRIRPVERMEPRRQRRLGPAQLPLASGNQALGQRPERASIAASLPCTSSTSILTAWRWIDANDNDNSVLTYLRYGKDSDSPLVVACNFTPVPRRGYRIGVPKPGHWREVLNSNAAIYGGTDEGNYGGAEYRTHRQPRLRAVTAAQPASAGHGDLQAIEVSTRHILGRVEHRFSGASAPCQVVRL